MSTHSVNVSGIAPSTTKETLHDFFTYVIGILRKVSPNQWSFCRDNISQSNDRIDQIELQESASEAVIHFEKSSAAKTALMLNGGTLDGATLTVTSEIPHQDDEAAREGHPDQSDKPRAGIAAEYLARGYVLSDHILQRAIEIDHKQGISKRFLNYFQTLDTSIGARALGPDQTISGKLHSSVSAATQQAKAVDEQKGISKMANDSSTDPPGASFTKYYAKAITSPLGQKVRAFYTSTSKQVQDIHEEARRIAEVQKTSAGPSAHTETAADEKTAASETYGATKS
ncbi:hypothetical protein H0H81_010795 [Sphagnurus paluster]|uniref:RRM domain-containing protein n=1 Tax=Sphagnurus paluster TaxID=117069 RepID=A0A9P7FWU3_9AGAR|nr:hypothetical protein H0H81_010795 [Sphagnurus paluster]